MSTTFLGRLDGNDGRDLRLYITIDGIADVFQEGSVDVPSTFVAASRPRRRVIQTIEHGQSELDLDRRRMVGGSLRVVLLDDAAGTLADLFGSRSRRGTFVTSTVSTTATTIPVQDTLLLPLLNGPVYIGGETITYTGSTLTSLTGCTRGAFGSRAQRHVGGTQQGASVFAQPASWVGRRVRLFGYFLEDDGTTTTSLRSALDTFRLEQAPAYLGQGRWELRCSHLSDEVAARRLGDGLQKVALQPTEPTISVTQLVWKTEQQTNQFPTPPASYWPSYAAVRFQDDDSVAVLRWRSTLDVGTSTTEIRTDRDGDRGTVQRVRDGSIGESIEHWVILEGGNAGTLALFALTSIIGDGANGGYDILPGTQRDTGAGGDEMRFGAGIPLAEIDTSAFISVGNNAIGGWSYIIHTAVDVADFLRDFCLATESFWFVDSAGLLTVRRLSEARTTPAVTIGDSLATGEPTVELAEEFIYPRARVKAGYDPVDGEFRDSLTVIDVEMANRYPERGDTLELETRGFALSRGSVTRGLISRAALETLVRRAMVDDGRGRLYVQVRCLLPALRLGLGDVVTLQLDLPDYEGGTLSGRRARVVSRQPDYDAGVVDLRLQVLEQLLHFAPACVIQSAAGTTLTLRTTGPEIPDGLPARMFGVGWNVAIINPTTGVVVTTTVASTTSPATVVVGAAGASAGDILRVDWTPATPAVQSANGYSQDEFIVQCPGSTTTRWR